MMFSLCAFIASLLKCRLSARCELMHEREFLHRQEIKKITDSLKYAILYTLKGGV